MQAIENKVLFPNNQSYYLKVADLKNNKGIIHTHNAYELNFIVDAIGKRFVAGYISNFRPGDFVFMSPGVPHCWEIENKDINPTAFTLYIKNDFFNENLLTIPELDFLNFLIKKSGQGIYINSHDNQLIISQFNEIKNCENSFQNLINILSLFKRISSYDIKKIPGNAEYVWNADSPNNFRIKKIYEYVFYNFKNEIKLNEVSSLIGLSEGAFCVFFKNNTKKTFSNFLKEVRIGYACKLLHSDIDRPISDVGFDCGYNNLANFNRQFKEVTNITPKDYRKKISS
jgi:AraC-like DNA-binding protein